MKKIIYNKLIYRILFACMAATLILMPACQKDDFGTPVINSVKVTDPEKTDSAFTQGVAGQMIVIQGENLDEVVGISINDQPISFNPVFCTSTNLIVRVPSDLQFGMMGASVNHQIMVETTHGSATFDFYVEPPQPVAYFYTSTNWTLLDQFGNEIVGPGQAGSILGANLYDIESIYMTSDTLTNPDKYDITEYSVNEDFTSINVKMPETIIPRGFIVIKCQAGTATVRFSYIHVQEPVINNISSDMPIHGDTVTIWGKNFAEIVSILIAADETTNIEIPAKDITVNEGLNELSFVFSFDSVITTGSKLTVINIAGQASTDFYTNVTADFDNLGTWAWGFDNTSFLMNDTLGVKIAPNYSGDYIGVNFDANTQTTNWLGMQTRDFSKPTTIPGSTPIDSIEFRFECFVGAPMDGVKFALSLGGGGPSIEAAQLVDKNSNQTEVGRWMTCSFPLSSLTAATKFGDFAYDDWGWSIGGAYMEPKNISATTHLICYFDNFRFYVRK